MRVEALDGNLGRQIDDVVTALRTCVGYRTVWIDPFGMLWHAEPEDEELEAMGHRYVGTFCRPAADDLREALVGIAWPKIDCLSVQTRGPASPQLALAM